MRTSISTDGRGLSTVAPLGSSRTLSEAGWSHDLRGNRNATVGPRLRTGGRVPTSQRCGKEATFALVRFGPKRCMTPIVPDVHSSGGMMDIGKIIREVEVERAPEPLLPPETLPDPLPERVPVEEPVS